MMPFVLALAQPTADVQRYYTGVEPTDVQDKNGKPTGEYRWVGTGELGNFGGVTAMSRRAKQYDSVLEAQQEAARLPRHPWGAWVPREFYDDLWAVECAGITAHIHAPTLDGARQKLLAQLGAVPEELMYWAKVNLLPEGAQVLM